MGHNHSHAHSSAKNIKTAFFLNLGFTVLEIIGGFWTNSVAIFADAIHDLGDSMSLGLAWFLQDYSEKGRNERYTYGYGRFSLLGALINALVLLGGSFFVLSEAIPRLLFPQQTNAPGMILFAIVGIIINGAAVIRLKDDHSMNARVVAWHMLEDVLGWIAVFVAGIILLFVDIPIIDPILAVLFTLYVLYNVIKNLRETLKLFLQMAPESLNVGKLEQQFLQIKGVRSSHHTHLWSLDGQQHVLTTHLVVNEQTSTDDVLRIKLTGQKIIRELKIDHLTMEIEYENEDCYMLECQE